MSATYHDSIPYTLFQLKKCLSMDLEISPDTGVLQAMAAYRPDTGYELKIGRGECQRPQASSRLEYMAKGASFVLGHNITHHDLPHLKATFPNCKVLEMPVVDTLHLNPLAFPQHPLSRVNHNCRFGVNQFCRFTSSAWPRCWAASVR